MTKSARLPVNQSRLKPMLWTHASGLRRARPAPRQSRATLLWIDDFQLGLEMYRSMLEELGYRVLTACSGEAGLRIAATHSVDLVVTDYEMPGMDGEAVATALKGLNSDLPIILFSGSTMVPARALEVVDTCCDKAGSREELLAAIHFLLQKKGRTFLQPPPIDGASHHGQRTVA